MKLRQKTGMGCRKVPWNAQCCNCHGSRGSSCGRSEESKVSKQINMQAGLISDKFSGGRERPSRGGKGKPKPPVFVTHSQGREQA